MEPINEDHGVTRRTFLGGAIIVGATAAAGALSGCASPNSGASTSNEATASASEDDTLLGSLISDTRRPDAAPIPPEAVPSAWDAEADVVVVGMGGGGLAAATYLAQQGLNVIALEKQATVGGATLHACNLVNIFGGARVQNEKNYGWPSYPLDIDAFLREYAKQHQYSVDDNLVRNLVLTAGEALDWLCDQEGTNIVCGMGLDMSNIDIAEGRQNHVMGMKNIIDAVEQCGIKAGVDFKLSTECIALVQDGDTIVGIKAKDNSNNEFYIKGTRGVILCAGGIGMNKDLLRLYLPSAYEGAVQGGPMPYHTGEAFRMGLGVGADISGYDSWSCHEGAIDESISGGDGQYWHYFWHGERQLFHNPWLIIDKLGSRVPYYSTAINYEPNPYNNLGDLPNCAAWMSRVGHRVYSICDSNFPESIWKLRPSIVQELGGDTCRKPITEDEADMLVDTSGLVSTDWLGEVDEAVERGAVKKADTLEELADMLLLDREVLKTAVENWNALCAKGVDDELATPYDPTWLIPVQDPPYYAAIIGGSIGKTMVGLRVYPDLNVMKPDGSPIPGLYANFTTAGGLAGECDYGGFWNSSPFAGNAMSWISGYVAAKTVLEKI
ncbi:MAG: FAD-binding protein [Actinobacteria bacterium]|nr:FAD-binding protein [Actinomycetota bacterium]